MQSLSDIESEVNRLAPIIGATANDLPTYGRTRDCGYSHVEVDAERYHLVSVERGEELSRESTVNFDELLYWIFKDATHSLAFAYEGANRIEGQDCRHIAFPKQVELMSRISPPFGARLAAELNETLARFPYA